MGKEDINHRAVAAVLEVLHVNKDLNKTGFANLLGIRPSTFTEILKGRMNASSELMEVLVSNYGISATWILTGEGEMFTTNQDVELHKSSEDALTCNLLDLIRQKDEIIRQQAKEIGRLEQALEDAQRKKGSPAYDATQPLLQMPANTDHQNRNGAKRCWYVDPLTRAYAYTQAHARDNFACNAVNRCNTHIYSTFPVYSRYTLLTRTPKNGFFPPFLFTAVYSL